MLILNTHFPRNHLITCLTIAQKKTKLRRRTCFNLGEQMCLDVIVSAGAGFYSKIEGFGTQMSDFFRIFSESFPWDKNGGFLHSDKATIREFRKVAPGVELFAYLPPL